MPSHVLSHPVGYVSPIDERTRAHTSTITPIIIDPSVIFQDMLPILGSQGVSLDFVDSPTSPQFQALVWLSLDPSFNLYSEERAVQRWVLAVLAFSLAPTTGASGRRLALSGWLTYTDECTWFSSTSGRSVCDTDGMYQIIDLQDMGLTGELPPELSLLSNSLSKFVVSSWSVVVGLEMG
jgi:hypothetical protein